MKEKRNIIITVICLLVLITLIGVPKLFLNNKEEVLPEVKLKEIEKNKTFAIMVPDINGNGYIPYEGNEWPTEIDDYLYSHSECVDNKGNMVENVVEYNQEDNTALLDTNQTVYCTLYFDKYNYMYVPVRNVDEKIGKFVVPQYMSSKVKNIEFVDKIKENLNSNEENTNWWDLSDTSQGTPKGSVIAWIEPINNNYDTLYIGSKVKIRATSLSHAFMAAEYVNNAEEPVTNLQKVEFNDMLDTSKTIDISHLFNHNTKLTDIIGIENWNVSNITSMLCTFISTGLADLNLISNWDVSNVETMRGMFMGCTNLNDISGLSKWKTSNLADIREMFSGCVKLSNINSLNNFDVSQVTIMYASFCKCTNLKDINALGEWDVSQVTDMYCMFLECSNLSNISVLNNWNIKNVENMRGMFVNCINLQTVNLSNWKTNKLKNVYDMFRGCTALEKIDIRNLILNQITEIDNYRNMFGMIPSTATIIVKDEEQRNWIQTYPTFPGTIKLPSEV